MNSNQFTCKEEAIGYIHKLYFSGQIIEEYKFVLSIDKNKCKIEMTKLSDIVNPGEENYKHINIENKTLLFTKLKEDQLRLDFLSNQGRLIYFMNNKMEKNYEAFDDYNCPHSFPVDTLAIAESLNAMTKYFLKKLKSG